MERMMKLQACLCGSCESSRVLRLHGPPGEEEDITISEDAPQRYEFAAMLRLLLFAHNLLKQIEGAGQRCGDDLEQANGNCS
jgi:hypothetical protein